MTNLFQNLNKYHQTFVVKTKLVPGFSHFGKKHNFSFLKRDHVLRSAKQLATNSYPQKIVTERPPFNIGFLSLDHCGSRLTDTSYHKKFADYFHSFSTDLAPTPGNLILEKASSLPQKKAKAAEDPLLVSKQSVVNRERGAGKLFMENRPRTRAKAKVPALAKNPNMFCLISINRTKNNTHSTISNLFGKNKTLWSISAGQLKLPGGRRKTRLSQRMVFRSCLEKALSFGYRYAVIHCKGTRGSKVRIFRFFGDSLSVLLIKDTTGAAHNGCRPPKMRRV
jgi:small subunit ribosomal protein S11